MSTPPPKSFDVSRFTGKNLYKALANDRLSFSEVSEHPQAKYIYRYLRDPEMKACIILVEYGYTDKDYLDDFASYYVKCFQDYDRHCKRLHFFAADLSKGDFRKRFLSMVQGKEDKFISKSYLGFVVARPLPVAIIGKTLLKPYPNIRKKVKRRKYCRVKGEKANLFGVNFTVASLAFQEQDHTLAACATVALWCCFHKTSEMFHTPVLTPAEITQKANEVVQTNRPIPSDGLTVDQIIYAISSNYLVAETIDVKKNIYLRSILYAYLHYGLPLILGLSIKDERVGHAIAITGYSLDVKKGVPLIDEVPENENPIPFTSSRIDRFFAHDDEMGPYSKLVIGPLDKPYESVILKASGNKKEPRPFLKSEVDEAKKAAANKLPSSSEQENEDSPFILWRIPEDREYKGRNSDNNKPLRFIPDVVVVPLYHKIRVNIQAIQKWVINLNSILRNQDMLEDIPREFLEWDVYLTDQYELKSDLEQILSDNRGALSVKRLQRHPRFIWRASLKCGSIYLMDLLGDATDIGGSANPFYDVIFYNDALEWKFRGIYSEKAEKTRERITSRQLDGFFFRHFHPK